MSFFPGENYRSASVTRYNHYMSSTPRFFVSPDLFSPEKFPLPAEAAYHARVVLRLRPGEAVILHDGENHAFDAVIETMEREEVTVAIAAKRTLEVESNVQVTVAQALPKTIDKAEQVLQHGTEIGAAGFILFQAERSVARMDAKDKIEKRLTRWRDIVRGAAEQSGRGILPPVVWQSWARDTAKIFSEYDAALILHETASVPLRTALDDLPPAARLLILIGPEGGFTDAEIALFTASGGKSVSLGPRVFRTETAALVGLAQILFYAENAGK